MMETNTLYREHILDLYKNPLNKGIIENPSFSSKCYNPLCGDEIEIQVKLDEDNIIENVKFLGKGCAISQASASLLTEEIKGKTLEEAKRITREQALELLEIPIASGRLKCALCSFSSLKEGYTKYNGGKNESSN